MYLLVSQKKTEDRIYEFVSLIFIIQTLYEFATF